jgi:hypothetical protein
MINSSSNNSNKSDFHKALSSVQELEIGFVGKKTGKKFSIPIWFVEKEGKLYFLPVGGSRSKWYRSILKNPKMELSASGKMANAEAHPIQDRKIVGNVMDMFRSKYGAGDVKRYYQGQDAAVEISI